MRGSRTIRTPVKKGLILEVLAVGGTVAEAAKHAGVGRSSIFAWKAADPSFAAEFEEAYDAGSDRYEMEARRRALGGSDVLLMFLMRQRSPARFNKKMLGDDADAMMPIGVAGEGNSAVQFYNFQLPRNGRDLPAADNPSTITIEGSVNDRDDEAAAA